MIKFLILCFLVPGLAYAQQSAERSPAVVPADHAIHILKITRDTIYVMNGSTMLYTVDTPEDSGLVSTVPTVQQLLQEIRSQNGSEQQYVVTDRYGTPKKEGRIAKGDRLFVAAKNGKATHTYHVFPQQKAMSGQLVLKKSEQTVNTKSDLTLYFTAGQRTPDATVTIYFPAGIPVTENNTTVNVIGRGEVKLSNLSSQYTGRAGTAYPYRKVGDFLIIEKNNHNTVLMLKHLDLRPANGADLVIKIKNVQLNKPGKYIVRASYQTTQPEALTSPEETAVLTATQTISDLERSPVKDLTYKETADTYTKTSFTWSPTKMPDAIQLLQSLDSGQSWSRCSQAHIDPRAGTANISALIPGKMYSFRLYAAGGAHRGYSNTVYFYSGKMDVKRFGVTGDGTTDETERINAAIDHINKTGGGTLLFSEGVYNVRTVHLKSNVYLYVSKGATIRALKGGDAPEATWFSDKQYRSGLSPTDKGPYADPENWLTKQDVGHHYFRNCMFFGERLDNIKIIGNGYITGNGNLVTGDGVMKNAPDNRCDKMFSLKLCTNLEIGGIYNENDLWYDSARDEPYYLTKNGSKDPNTDNMLHIDRAGHFVLLATGTDSIHVHDTYFAKAEPSNARDIYDFMQCNHVIARNIYSKVSSDDIIKPGSDCSLGFTRKATDYKVRNIIGDTNCNLFQIGSETADDITDIHVDNIYVLGANKAGFSISTNDGATIKDIHLNCGHTGPLNVRSKMYRTFTPFFISISNRGRILGARVEQFKFKENGEQHNELLVTNVNIGSVENIILNSIDVMEVYGGSSFGKNNVRWKAYDGSQRKATPIVAGYQLPDAAMVEGGLNFTLPDKKHTGYIKQITFNDVHVLVKGGNPVSDTSAHPPELGVGQYNASNLKVQPSFGLWARHVQDLTVRNCSFTYEQPDGRYPIFLDDVMGALVTGVKTMTTTENGTVIKLKNSSKVVEQP
jgi:polygalacturonase